MHHFSGWKPSDHPFSPIPLRDVSSRPVQFFFQRSPKCIPSFPSPLLFQTFNTGIISEPPWLDYLPLDFPHKSILYTYSRLNLPPEISCSMSLCHEMLSSFPLPIKIKSQTTWPGLKGPYWLLLPDFLLLYPCLKSATNIPTPRPLPRLFSLFAMLPKPRPCLCPRSFRKPLYSSHLQ